MYDTNFKNQAVKEYFNGGSLMNTSKKFGVSRSALRDWVNEYRENMAILMEGTGETMKNTTSSAGFAQKDVGVDNYDQRKVEQQNKQESNLTILLHEDDNVEPSMILKSVNINIGGQEVKLSKLDIKKLTEIFHYFEE